jgi:tetratricopeptide (TPR) repeat protein
MTFTLAAPAVAHQQAPASAAQESSDPVELVKQGAKLRQAGKQDEALAVYNRALALKPDLFEAHLGAGISLDLKGEYAEARQHLAKAIELAPEGSKETALTAMAVSYAFEGRAKDSAVYYQQMYDRAVAAQLFTDAGATANALARVYLESGDLDNALKWYQTGYETAKRQRNLSEADRNLAEMRWHHAQARIAARRGNIAEAREHAATVKSLVEQGAETMPVYQYLAGYVAFYAKDYDTAVAELQKANLQDPFILSLIAQSYEKKGDAAQAREYYAKVLASNAHNPNNAFARPLAKSKIQNLRSSNLGLPIY